MNLTSPTELKSKYKRRLNFEELTNSSVETRLYNFRRRLYVSHIGFHAPCRMMILQKSKNTHEAWTSDQWNKSSPKIYASERRVKRPTIRI